MGLNEVAKTRILVADDHPLMRRALRDVLEREPDFEVVGEAGNGAEAVELAVRLEPDLVTMDVSMPVMNGVEATKQIKAERPLTLILIFTIVTDINTVFGILQAGASGYLVKSALGPEVVRTVRTLVAGDSVLAPSVLEELLKYATRHDLVSPMSTKADASRRISPKAREILTLTARGLSNKEIGRELGITEATVKSYFVEIFGYLNVRSRTEAVFVGLKSGAIRLEDIG